MIKLSIQRKLILSGIIVLIVTPFVTYIGAKLYVADTRNCAAAWSFCSLHEVSTALFIATGLVLIASALFTLAVLKRNRG